MSNYFQKTTVQSGSPRGGSRTWTVPDACGARSFRGKAPLLPDSGSRSLSSVWLAFWICILGLSVPRSALAYPPAPPHIIYGIVRDELGNPLTVPGANLILETLAGPRLTTLVVSGLGPAKNYKLELPMDSGVTDDMYKPTAVRPAMQFRIQVRIGKNTYLPIQMKGDYSRIGLPGEETRLDLTLGEDSDGDGLPDAWELALIAKMGGGKSLKDIRPGDDLDGDRLSNLEEYISGTYALDPKDGFTLKAIDASHGVVRLEFTAVRERNYSVYGSVDMGSWTLVPFRFSTDDPGVPAARSYYQSTDVRPLQVDVDPQTGGESFRFFKLRVQ